MDDGIRINKFLSEAGYCSRRQADRYIENGRVSINGKPAVPGSKVTSSDIVCVNGDIIRKDDQPVILAYNKPIGIVCSTKEKYNIIDYIDYPIRIYPVGRLDKNSEGLILLTNQGDITDSILRSSNFHEKEYVVRVNKDINDEFIYGMERGVPILDTVTRPCKIIPKDSRVFHIIITQGLNRQIRRMCEYFDYRVLSLKRIRIMNITLSGLKTGEYRELTPDEINELRKELDLQQNIYVSFHHHKK